jgi:photosystem II stability/assembly factor-like uncharacterized protein
MTIIPNVRLQESTALQFVNKRTGFALFGGYGGGPSRLFKTMNGGHTWVVLHPDVVP